MSGFENAVVVARNMNFNYTAPNPHLGIITAAGMLPIGTGNTTPIPEILGGSITSPLGTVSIGYSSPNITIDVTGGSMAVQQLTVDGAQIIVPSGSPSNLTITGNTVANSTHAKAVYLNKNSSSSASIDVQVAAAISSTNITKTGLSAFSSSMFSVDANGFVTLLGGGAAIESVAVQTGTSPIVPTSGGQITINGAVVAAGTHPVRTDGTGANTMALEVQTSQAIASTNAANIGLSAFDSARFTVDANGFVSINGSGVGETITGNSGGALSPSAGNWNIQGSSTAAGTSPVTTSGSGSTLTVNVQKSQAIASTNAANVGLSSFNSSQFSVDANGFVSTSGTGIGNTITGDSGGALSPTSGNWNIKGRSGSQTSGSGSTLTINSPPYSDQGSSTTVTLNSGSFSTAAITLTLPASAGLANGDLFEFICTTSSALVIQAVGTQKIRIGSLISSAGGSATSSNTGDAVVLRFRATDGILYATSVIGVWTLA